MPSDDKTVQITFDLPPDYPAEYVTNLVAQFTEHDFTITFFDVRPPLLIGTEAEKREQLEGVSVIHAIPKARLVVAASKMHEFVQVLQDNLKTYQALKSAQGKEN